MATDLMSIAKSGAAAVARGAGRDRATTSPMPRPTGYVRRSVSLSELSSGGLPQTPTAINLSGVRVQAWCATPIPSASPKCAAPAPMPRAPMPKCRGWKMSKRQLSSQASIPRSSISKPACSSWCHDPTDSSLRATVIEQSRTMAQTFNIASQSLDAAGNGLRFEAQDGVDSRSTPSRPAWRG